MRGMLGKKHTPETRQKISEAMQGKHHSLETRKRISEANRGHKVSLDTRRKLSEINRGERHPRWKGGRICRNGYIFITIHNHPHANARGEVREHRLVMEESLGRFLEPWEVVHHINGIRDDNRIENLELLPKGGHGLISKVTGARILVIKEEVKTWRDAYFQLLMIAIIKT